MIGISRILAAAAEQFHDDQGLRLPKALAPFEVVVISANTDDDRVGAETGADLRRAVARRRRRRGGRPRRTRREEVADADLVGYPVHIVVGRVALRRGTADLKLRATGDRSQAR